VKTSPTEELTFTVYFHPAMENRQYREPSMSIAEFDTYTEAENRIEALIGEHTWIGGFSIGVTRREKEIDSVTRRP
jgi:hypothetical protein